MGIMDRLLSLQVYGTGIWECGEGMMDEVEMWDLDQQHSQHPRRE